MALQRAVCYQRKTVVPVTFAATVVVQILSSSFFRKRDLANRGLLDKLYRGIFLLFLLFRFFYSALPTGNLHSLCGVAAQLYLPSVCECLCVFVCLCVSFG